MRAPSVGCDPRVVREVCYSWVVKYPPRGLTFHDVDRYESSTAGIRKTLKKEATM